MNEKTVPTYLNDHLALMTTEIELLDRVQGSNSGSPLGDDLKAFSEAVTSQHEAVQQLIESEGGSASSIKQAAAWLGEKLGRLKPNDGSSEYTDLARVVELEALMGLAFSRRTMWAVLKDLAMQCGASTDQRAAMERQAQRQLAALQEHHNRAVVAAFEHRVTNV